MKRKDAWLAKAMFGTDAEKTTLMNNLRITGNAAPKLAFDNSVRGFFGEMVAEKAIKDDVVFPDCQCRFDVWNDWVFEKGDCIHSPAEPDGCVYLYDDLPHSFDIKTTLRPTIRETEGSTEIIFVRTHNAEFIIWVSGDTLTLCDRISPSYAQDTIKAPAAYEVITQLDIGCYKRQTIKELRNLANEI